MAIPYAYIDDVWNNEYPTQKQKEKKHKHRKKDPLCKLYERSNPEHVIEGYDQEQDDFFSLEAYPKDDVSLLKGKYPSKKKPSKKIVEKYIEAEESEIENEIQSEDEDEDEDEMLKNKQLPMRVENKSEMYFNSFLYILSGVFMLLVFEQILHFGARIKGNI